jgi:hypothetical protein
MIRPFCLMRKPRLSVGNVPKVTEMGEWGGGQQDNQIT